MEAFINSIASTLRAGALPLADAMPIIVLIVAIAVAVALIAYFIKSVVQK